MLIMSALPLQHRVFSYTDRGFYSEQIRRIWRFFPEEQTLFIKHDDLKREPNQVLNRISTYLSISSFNINENKDIHSRPYINKLSKEDYEFLYELYFHEINTLEKMLSWDCSDWKSKKENTIIKWLKRQK